MDNINNYNSGIDVIDFDDEIFSKLFDADPNAIPLPIKSDSTNQIDDIDIQPDNSRKTKMDNVNNYNSGINNIDIEYEIFSKLFDVDPNAIPLPIKSDSTNQIDDIDIQPDNSRKTKMDNVNNYNSGINNIDIEYEIFSKLFDVDPNAIPLPIKSDSTNQIDDIDIQSDNSKKRKIELTNLPYEGVNGGENENKNKLIEKIKEIRTFILNLDENDVILPKNIQQFRNYLTPFCNLFEIKFILPKNQPLIIFKKNLKELKIKMDGQPTFKLPDNISNKTIEIWLNTMDQLKNELEKITSDSTNQIDDIDIQPDNSRKRKIELTNLPYGGENENKNKLIEKIEEIITFILNLDPNDVILPKNLQQFRDCLVPFCNLFEIKFKLPKNQTLIFFKTNLNTLQIQMNRLPEFKLPDNFSNTLIETWLDITDQLKKGLEEITQSTSK